MTQSTTHDEDLAGTDQAAPPSQATNWEQRYNGLNGKLLQVQKQLAEAKSSFEEERRGWQEERQGWQSERTQLAAETDGLRQALTAGERQLSELTGQWGSLQGDFEAKTREAETLAAQLARQGAMLKYPALVSEPVLKLVQASSLSGEELEATLEALAAGQQQLVQQTYQEAQTGTTQPARPAAAPASARQEQATDAWRSALDAMQKGDMTLFGDRYHEYLALLDQSGQGQMSRPRVL